MPKKIKLRTMVKNTFGIVIGALLVGIANAWFLIPYKIAPGGVSGISQIFFHLYNFPAGVTIIILNIPLFIVGTRLISRQFGLTSLLGMFISAIFTDLFALPRFYKYGIFVDIINRYNAGKTPNLWAMTDNFLLASIAGSILLGIGVGTIFRFRATTGGTDIPVMILKKYFNIPITAAYLMIETSIIITVGLVFREPNIVILSFFNLLITSLVCDVAAEGLPVVKGAMIVSDESDKIRQRIMDELDRGVTILHGEGGYQLTPKRILYVAITRKQIGELRDIVRQEDPKAFVTLNDVHDVMGYGFRQRTIEL